MAAFLHVNNCICENISCQMKHSLFWRFWCHFGANKLNWLFYWHNTYKEFVPVPVCPGTGSDRFQETRLSGSEPRLSPPPKKSSGQKVFRPTKGKPRTDFRLDCKRNTWMLWMFLDFISAVFDMLCVALWKILNTKYNLKMTCKDCKHHWQSCRQPRSEDDLSHIGGVANVTVVRPEQKYE